MEIRLRLSKDARDTATGQIINDWWLRTCRNGTSSQETFRENTFLSCRICLNKYGLSIVCSWQRFHSLYRVELACWLTLSIQSFVLFITSYHAEKHSKYAMGLLKNVPVRFWNCFKKFFNSNDRVAIVEFISWV